MAILNAAKQVRPTYIYIVAGVITFIATIVAIFKIPKPKRKGPGFSLIAATCAVAGLVAIANGVFLIQEKSAAKALEQLASAKGAANLNASLKGAGATVVGGATAAV